MADTLNNKPKLQLGSGFVKNGSVSPVTPTKLLINHGKPNFTIQRSPKIDEQRKFPDPIKNDIESFKNDNNNNNNNNENSNHVVLTNTKFFGALNNVNNNNVVKENQTEESDTFENGNVHKVALRRTATLPVATKPSQDDNVPEFILRQRAIQERLSKENVLDFDKRRSGYFTHVVISPTSPSRTSFAETMSSPRINPALEIPAPQVQVKKDVETKTEPEIKIEPVVENPQEVELENHKEKEVEETVHKVTEEAELPAASHSEENNVQVENVKETDEPKLQVESHNTETEVQVENHKQTEQVDDDDEVANAIEEVNKAIAGEDMPAEDEQQIEENLPEKDHDTQSVHIEANVEIIEETKQENPTVNGHKIDENNNAGESITISHTNGLDAPHLSSPDPSGALGVNFEPKTVVSFSKDLSAGENKYPDTVKIEVNGQHVEDSELAELAKLKFDIKADENDIQVVPTIKTE